jgi:kynurenine formamidase
MAPPQGLDTSSKQGVVYVQSGGADQSYDLYWPTASSVVSTPLLVFIHGGAWQSGDKSEYKALGTAFAQMGIITAVVNYRLSSKIQHPGPVEDVARAIAHLAKNAQGYDPKKIFVMGHSAGAHMCGMLAAQPELMTNAGLPKECLPKGLIGLQGIYDIPKLVKTWPTYRGGFIEKAFGKDALWPTASPTRLPIKLKSEWLLVHAKGDELVDAGQTQNFMDHLTKEGVDLDFHDPGQLRHFAVVQAFRDADSDLFKWVVKFVSALR